MSKYDPKFCKKIIELGKLGYSVHELAQELDICTSTLYVWANNYHEFGEAKDKACTNYLAWLSKIGKSNLENRNFNSRTHELMWVGASHHAAQRAIKRGIAETPNPTQQCYLIINALLDGSIEPDRADTLINLILNTHKVAETEQIRKEFELLKGEMQTAEGGNGIPAPANKNC